MDRQRHPIPPRCPVTGEPLFVSELRSEHSGITIRGEFEVPKFGLLSEEQLHLLEVFIRSRGVITVMEKQLGVSYPTVKARIESLIDSLGYEPYVQDKKRDRHATAESKRKILDRLEKGEIDPKEAKRQIKELEV